MTAAVLEELSEEEAYLFSILDDSSGIDQAEFLWAVAPEKDNPTGTFRAYPYQWRWWRNPSPLQIDQCARSVGKSLSIKLRLFAFPFVHPGYEAVITAPELVHLEPIVGLIEGQFEDTRLGREIRPSGRSAVTHRPFMMQFANGARIIGRIPQRDGRGVKGIHPLWLELDEACFPAGTTVLCRRGFVAIEDVEVGDYVLTHRNRWRRVTHVWERGLRNAVSVRGQGHPGIVCTPNHKFWARDVLEWKDRRNKWGVKEMAPSGWTGASDLEESFWSSPTSFPAGPAPAPIPRSRTGSSYEIPISRPFLWALGLYLAEGSTSRTSPKYDVNKSTWSVHIDEVDYVVKMLEAAGLRPFVQPVQNTAKCMNVVVAHAELARWLHRECGRGAHGKRLPAWVLGLPEGDRRAVLEGAVYGDGNEDHDERYAPGRWKYATVSRTLAVGLRLLALSLGYSVSFHQGTNGNYAREIRGRAIGGGVNYQLVGSLVGQGFDDEEKRWSSVKEVTPLPPVPMYDLTVEEDHSFVAEGIVVSNSDYPTAGWTELTETLQRGKENAMWRAHGVTRGVRDKFYEYTQDTPDNRWTVHRIVAMARPNWTDEERQEKIAMYGSRHDPDYRRNVLGAHGDATNPLFVLHRLMRGVDSDLSSDYNTEEYYHLELRAEQVEDVGDILSLVDIPPQHVNTKKYKVFWAGMDVGLTSDPSEILVFAEYHPDAAERKADAAAKRSVPEEGVSRLKLLARFSLHRIEAPLQRRIIGHIIDTYKPVAFAMDSTGLGLPIYQEIMFEAKDERLTPAERTRAQLHVDTIRGYNFSQKVLVEIDQSKLTLLPEDADVDEIVKEGGILKLVLEASTDELRNRVDTQRLLLPWDLGLIKEFQGQTMSYSKSPIDQYGRNRQTFSKGSFHALDGARMGIFAHAQAAIEEFTKPKEREAVLDSFMQY